MAGYTDWDNANAFERFEERGDVVADDVAEELAAEAEELQTDLALARARGHEPTIVAILKDLDAVNAELRDRLPSRRAS